MERSDTIHLVGVLFFAHLGVPEKERAVPQRLGLTLTLHLSAQCETFADDLARTTDYSAVRRAALAIAGERPRRLLEGLAADLAAGILAKFPGCSAVELEVRKWVLPDTEFVAVRLFRSRSAN